MSFRGRPVRVAMLALLVSSAVGAGCGTGLFGKVYEYEEDLYVSLDGSASVIVNTSLAALHTLRGLPVEAMQAGRVDRDEIRRLFESPVTEVTRVSRPWRRHGRTFVQIRLNVPDIRRLPQASPFSWSTYTLDHQGTNYLFRQVVGTSAHRPGTLKNVGWNGSELVAFRLHLPSRILEHNARDVETDVPSSIQRGNILAWEQRLTDRLDSRPITIEVRMDQQSILYQTLWLFAGAFGAAVLLLGTVVWLTMRKGAKEAVTSPS